MTLRRLTRLAPPLALFVLVLGLGLSGCGNSLDETSPNASAPGSTQGRIPDTGPNAAVGSDISPPPPEPVPPLGADSDTPDIPDPS